MERKCPKALVSHWDGSEVLPEKRPLASISRCVQSHGGNRENDLVRVFSVSAHSHHVTALSPWDAWGGRGFSFPLFTDESQEG